MKTARRISDRNGFAVYDAGGGKYIRAWKTVLGNISVDECRADGDWINNEWLVDSGNYPSRDAAVESLGYTVVRGDEPAPHRWPVNIADRFEYPLTCDDVGSNGNCGEDCPVRLRGDCETEREQAQPPTHTNADDRPTVWRDGDGYRASDGAPVATKWATHPDRGARSFEACVNGRGALLMVRDSDIEANPCDLCADTESCVFEQLGYRLVDGPPEQEPKQEPEQELSLAHQRWLAVQKEAIAIEAAINRAAECAAHDHIAVLPCPDCLAGLPSSLVTAMNAGTADCPKCRASARRCRYRACRGLLADSWDSQRGRMVRRCVECGNE